jgi:hypothetical protein
LALPICLFKALSKHYVYPQKNTWKLVDTEESSFSNETKALFETSIYPLKVSLPKLSCPVPSLADMRNNVVLNFKQSHGSTGKRVQKCLDRFKKHFKLPDYYFAIDDSNPVLMESGERLAFIKKHLNAGESETNTQQEVLTSFFHLLDYFPKATKPHTALHQAILIYYRVSNMVSRDLLFYETACTHVC